MEEFAVLYFQFLRYFHFLIILYKFDNKVFSTNQYKFDNTVWLGDPDLLLNYLMALITLKRVKTKTK